LRISYLLINLAFIPDDRLLVLIVPIKEWDDLSESLIKK
jgi:hypothetical protein